MAAPRQQESAQRIVNQRADEGENKIAVDVVDPAVVVVADPAAVLNAAAETEAWPAPKAEAEVQVDAEPILMSLAVCVHNEEKRNT